MEHTEITITTAKPEDARVLAQIKQVIWLATYRNAELGIDEKDILSKDFLCEERIAKRAEHMQRDDGINHTLVARVGGEIVGYGRAVKGVDFNEIVTLYLLPKWQGRGIGSRLMRQELDWLGEEKDVVLGVVLYNAKAIRFYEKFGFKLRGEVGHTEPTFPSGRDLPELEMRRNGLSR
jgi:ribosomal protein S18 acetylase RimI-like enzyme